MMNVRIVPCWDKMRTFVMDYSLPIIHYPSLEQVQGTVHVLRMQLFSRNGVTFIIRSTGASKFSRLTFRPLFVEASHETSVTFLSSK